MTDKITVSDNAELASKLLKVNPIVENGETIFEVESAKESMILLDTWGIHSARYIGQQDIAIAEANNEWLRIHGFW